MGLVTWPWIMVLTLLISWIIHWGKLGYTYIYRLIFELQKIPKIIDPMKTIKSQSRNLTISQSYNITFKVGYLPTYYLTKVNTRDLIGSKNVMWMHVGTFEDILKYWCWTCSRWMRHSMNIWCHAPSSLWSLFIPSKHYMKGNLQSIAFSFTCVGYNLILSFPHFSLRYSRLECKKNINSLKQETCLHFV